MTQRKYRLGTCYRSAIDINASIKVTCEKGYEVFYETEICEGEGISFASFSDPTCYNSERHMCHNPNYIPTNPPTNPPTKPPTNDTISSASFLEGSVVLSFVSYFFLCVVFV